MSAKEMFEKLGYPLFLDDKSSLIYRKHNDYEDNIVIFYKDRKNYKVQFVDWIDHMDNNWKPMSKRDENLKHCSYYGKWQLAEYPISVKLHNAISKQLEELGWNK